MARAGVTAERLTEAAAELADEAGFDAVSLSALARRFGVKDASLYSHVRNLQELRVRVTLLALAELAEQVSDAMAGRAARDALVAFATTYRRYARQHPGRWAALQMELDPATAEASAARRHAELTRAVLRGYRLEEPDQTDAARLVLGAIHGFLGLEASGGFGHNPRDLDASFGAALDALDVALRHWPASMHR